MKKHYSFGNRFVFNTLPSPEKPGDTGKQTLDQLSKTIETSYKQQLQMQKEISEKMSPVAKEQARHSQLISEMNEERARDNYQHNVSRDMEFFGNTIHVEMGKDGSFQEYLDGKPVDFLNWLLTQQNKGNTTNNA